ncbi:hypothetical protein ACKWTF_001824 [Chironomus riparius]
MNSSKRTNNMEPLHNSTLRPESRRGRDVRNNTTMSTPRSSRQQTPVMDNDNDMVCLCFKPTPQMMNQMASNGCNCTCNMNHIDDNMDISGIERMEPDQSSKMNRSKRLLRRDKNMHELEETMAEISMQNDFEETILEVEDDPSNVTPLGRHYRINSFR